MKSTIRIASVALTMLAAGNLRAADAAKEWQKGPSDAWFVKWDEAAAESKKTGKPIFVLKTGSDWCGWCIRLRKNVLSKPEFEAFAKKNLVLLYLDSPSKTPLCAEQKKHNQEVSRKLSLGGGVPNASIVTADGKKLGSISGGGLDLDAYLEKLKELLGKGLVKVDEKTAAPEVAQRHNMKLPYALMPKSGRIADYDFEGSATNRVPSAGKIISRDLQIVAGALYSPGVYGNCCRIDIPEINYDNLTVALSFMPEGANKGSWIPVFSFGEPWGSSVRWFNASIRQDHTLEFGFNAYGYTIKTGVEVKMGEWNYLVCSVDAVNKKVVASVNGNVCEWELPVDFAWQFSHTRSREECRCIGFSNRNFGLVYKGSIDDFLVYDCALGKDEVSAIAAGKSPARREASSSGRTVHKTAVRRDVAAIPGGKWLFVPSTERSLYWNGEMRDGNWTLDVHREGANLVVQPQYTRGSGVLDLKKPVVDETGAKLAVTGVGYSRGGCHCSYHPSVTEVVLPDTLTKIYPEAFSCCKFPSVAIPEGVSEIGEQAFSHCSNLSGVVIPSSVKEIGDRAFQECKSLVSVDIRGADVKVAKLAFRGDTPVGKKMPDLSKPVGPIRVVVGKDEGEIGNKESVAPQATKNAPASESWQRGPSNAWFVKWDEASAEAKKTGKPIFVLKTGSDWCGWCIRLRKNVLSKPEFEAFAKKNLVLLYLDSPSKTPLCAEQKKHNQEVSRKLSLGGGVPNASIVTADGKKLGSISGGGLGLEDYLKKLEGIVGKDCECREEVPPSKQQVKAERNRKLPYEFMPKNCRIADFDFEGLEANNKAGTRACVTGSNVEVKDGSLVFNGKYVYRGGSDINVPELNFDNFTLAMSFLPQAWPKGFGQLFILGRNKGNPLSVCLRDGRMNFRLGNSENIALQSAVNLNEWNWFVCSIDAVSRKVCIAVNGKRETTRSLSPDFSWPIANGSDDPDLRGFHFGDPGFGARYTGLVDEFVVYNRALSAEEVDRIVQRLSPVEKSDGGATSVSMKRAAKFVKPVPGAWLLKPAENRSYFWNATMEKDGVVLGAHVEGDEVCVQPLSHAAVSIDLTAPVVSDEGKSCKIVGIGAKKTFGGAEKKGQAVLRDVLLPDTLEAIYAQAFEDCEIEHVVLPKLVRVIGNDAFKGCVKLKDVALPDGLRTIGRHAFYRCTDLSAVEIPTTVERIDGWAFMNCGSLLSVKVKGPTRLGQRAFAGSTPAGSKLPTGTTTGPVTLEAKKDASLAYALNGRMKEPFLNSLKFGDCVRFISGCGSIRFTRCPEIADRMDTSYHKVGPELVCGSSACWVITEDAEGTDIKSRRSLDLASKMLSETFPKIKLNPVTWKNTEDWPQSVSGLDVYYGRQELLYKAIEANDFSECVASSRTEADGYRLDFRVWGSKSSKTVFLSFDIVDTIMQRAWGVEP